ncbi:MAG: OmpA/MotB family protein, partial [Desulfatiglandales bacterium]
DMSMLYQRSRQVLVSEDLKDIASVDLVKDKAVRIILTGDVLFDSGKAALKPEAVESLRKIAGILRETSFAVNVVGHTDDVPISTEEFPSNWELSTMRACVTARFLMDEAAIPPDHVYVTGHAEYQPVRDDIDPESRAANRRVEIIMTKERPYGTFNASPAANLNDRPRSGHEHIHFEDLR